MKFIDVDKDSLNSTDLSILERINENPDFFCKNNIKVLAKYYNCAASSITRACYKFGFDSFKSAQLKVNEKMTVSTEYYTVDDSGTSNALINNISYSILFNVRETFDTIDRKLVENIAMLILESDLAVIYGVEERKYAAQTFASRLSSININSKIVTNSYDFIQKAIYGTKNSVCVIIMREKPWNEIYNLIDWAVNEKLMNVVLITRNVDDIKETIRSKNINELKIRYLPYKNIKKHDKVKMNNIFTYSGEQILFECIYQLVLQLKPDIEDKLASVEDLYIKLVNKANN